MKGRKTNKKGEFLIKKIEPGSYTLQAIHKVLGTGTAAVTVKNKNLQVKITIPSKPVPQYTVGSQEKQFDQNPGSKYFKYWSPYRRSLSIEGNPQTF